MIKEVQEKEKSRLKDLEKGVLTGVAATVAACEQAQYMQSRKKSSNLKNKSGFHRKP